VPTLGSTRVFGQQGVVTIGLKRRPVRDLYHWLVTGPWTRLVLLFALVHFATQALFGIAHLLVAARVPASGSVLPALLGAAPAQPGEPAAAFSARMLAWGAIAAVRGFVEWAELVIGAGVVLAKFSLVRARVLFSNVAVVGPHEGGQALMFRMANERTSHIVDAKISVLLVRTEIVDGEPVRKAYDLELSRKGSALFSHAWTAIHPITRTSPLSGETAESLERAEGEVIVSLSGFDEGLVKTVHARHVYPASRLRWNARFRQIVKTLPDGRHAVDYRKFHKVKALDEERETPPERTPARKAR
jgi:inward rectifier potassium channel